MLIRNKPNKSGTVCVQIIFKKGGKYRVVKTIGSSKDPERIALLVDRANEYLRHPTEQLPLFSTLSETDIIIKNFIVQIMRYLDQFCRKRRSNKNNKAFSK